MEIYQKAFDIIERYFGTEEEDKDVSAIYNYLHSNVTTKIFPLQIAPAADVNTNQFAFAQPGGEGQQAGVGVPQQGFNF